MQSRVIAIKQGCRDLWE